MDFSKIKKISFILLILFILLFPFWCVRGLCAEVETVEGELIPRLSFDTNHNFFYESTNSVIAFNIEPGYIYHFTCNIESGRPIAISDSKPAVNVNYNILANVAYGETYSYQGSGVFLTSGYYAFTVTREKVEGMNSAIGDLVDNVGINGIWNIFDISVNYIVVVVLFAFGCYIIFRFIKKVSRGKEGL